MTRAVWMGNMCVGYGRCPSAVRADYNGVDAKRDGDCEYPGSSDVGRWRSMTFVWCPRCLFAHDDAALGLLVTSHVINETRYGIRYDTIRYFNVRSKADISQLNLPRGWEAFSSPPCWSGQSPSHPSQTRELMMPPAGRIREQNEQDPGRVTHTRQEAGSNDFLAVGPALRVLQLNVEGLSAAERSIIRESTPWSGRWRSHMAGIYSDCSTREIIIVTR